MQLYDLGNGATVINALVNDIPALKLQPALIHADAPYGDITKETWDTADVDGWLQLFRDFEYLGEGVPIYWWGGIGKLRNRPFLEFALRLEKETNWGIKDWITWKKKRAYGKPNDYLFVREECLVCTLNGSKFKVFNKPYLAEKRGYAGFKSNIVVGKFEGIFHENETCTVLPSRSQAQSERDVLFLLRQNDVLEKPQSEDAKAQGVVGQKQGASNGLLEGVGKTEPNKENFDESSLQSEETRFLLQSNGKRLAGGLDRRVPGVWDTDWSKTSEATRFSISGQNRQLCWVCTREYLYNVLAGQSIEDGRDLRGTSEASGLFEKRTVEITISDVKYPALSEYKRRGNVWDETELMRNKRHPCHKAPIVCKIPIEVHTNPGDIVLDLYAGSAETSVQALAMGRKTIAVEGSQEECVKIIDYLGKL